MPIDPQIALSFRSPQIDSPATLATQTAALRNSSIQAASGLERIKAEQLANQETELKRKDDQIITQKFLQAGGVPDKHVQLAAEAGARPQAVQALQQHYGAIAEQKAKTSKDQADADKYTNDRLSALTRQTLGMPDDQLAAAWPALKQQALAISPKLNLPDQPPTQDQLQHLNALFQTNESLDKKAAEMRAQASEQRAAQMQPLNVQEKQGAVAAQGAALPGIQAKSDIEAASANALKQMTRGDWDKGLDSVIPDKTSPLYQRTQAEMQLALSKGDLKGAQDAIRRGGDQIGRTETAVATAKATAPIKIDIAAQTAGARADAAGLTDDDYARAGEQYARTGVMPALGRDSVTRGRIVKASNQWARENGFKPGDLVQMQAAYSGDKASLVNFQKQRDQIVSFEQTAQKNLDLFLNAAAKIPNTGVPWINAPLRTLDEKLVGSANMSAVNAARQVANNEIAKVTIGGGLSGVLSDSARHEVESFNPKSATLAQTIAVAKVLKQDMANRHGAMDATLSDIKSRIGGGAGPAKVEKWGFDSKGNLVKQ